MAEHYWPGQLISDLPYEETANTLFIDSLPAVQGHEYEHGYDANWPAGMASYGLNNLIWRVVGDGSTVSFYCETTTPPNATTDSGLYLSLQVPGHSSTLPAHKSGTGFGPGSGMVAFSMGADLVANSAAPRSAGFTLTLAAGVTYYLNVGAVYRRGSVTLANSYADQTYHLKVWKSPALNDLRAAAADVVIATDGGVYHSPDTLNPSYTSNYTGGFDDLAGLSLLHTAWWMYEPKTACEYLAIGQMEPDGFENGVLRAYLENPPGTYTAQQTTYLNPGSITGNVGAGQKVWFVMGVYGNPNSTTDFAQIYTLQVNGDESVAQAPDNGQPPIPDSGDGGVPLPLLLPPFLPALAPTNHIGVGPAVDTPPEATTPVWRGAPNHGVNRTITPWTSRPTLRMPEAQSSSFTLRLTGGSEARTDHEVPRDQAIVIQEMATDIWWRRRDPTRHTIDGIARFNADKVDISLTDTGVRMSVSWIDYQGLLEDRLVLQYLDTVNAESMWDTGTLITDILRFAIPTNAGIDLTNIAASTAFALGVTNKPFELPTGTTIADVMTNLLDISVTPWEWWINMPGVDTLRPKLMFVQGTRGANRNITLFDIGSGQGPIQSWTMQAAADRYANALFYNGSEGGVVVDLPAEIAQYGQRDASDSDASLKGDLARITSAATKKLQKLADQTPTWTLTLVNGFWEGRQHIDIGDWVTVHIALGAEVLSGLHRVTELQCDVDSSGTETVTLTVGPPRPSRDTRSRRSVLARLVRTLKRYERKGS